MPDDDDDFDQPPDDALVSVGELEGDDLPDPEDTDLSDTGVDLPDEED